MSEKHETSSANISASKSSILLVTNIPWSVSDFRYATMSFINREKMIGELTQPCRVPINERTAELSHRNPVGGKACSSTK